jgi:hypothetical protein
MDRDDLVRVYRTFNAAAEPFQRQSLASEHGDGEDSAP